VSKFPREGLKVDKQPSLHH